MIILRFLFLGLFLSVAQAKPTEIVLWHSLAGQLGTELQALVNGFNQSQIHYIIKPVYKGDYIESLTSFAAAFQAKEPPALIQVFEVGSTTMLAPKGIIKPVSELMQEQGFPLPKDIFFPAVRSYYSEQGQLMAMPLNSSIPVLFYNADTLVKVGYSQDSFPQTWDELEILAGKLKKAGYQCTYTTAYPAWILIESFSALHGLPMIDSSHTKANYNSKKMIAHLTRLRRWQKLHYFQYGGRSDDATILFTSGHCPLFSQSSGGYNSLSSLVNFRLGVAPMPLDKNISEQRYNNVIGGAALWVTANQSTKVYQGIAEFFNYLIKTDVQERWHLHTGYLPLGMQGIHSSHPVLAIAQLDLYGKYSRETSRINAQNQIRAINDEALENIFAGIKSSQQAMDEAVVRANQALSRFKRNNM